MILVKEMMNKKVVAIKLTDSVKKICQVLTKNMITGVPVVDNKKEILGFVSERDIIAAVNKPNFMKKTAKELMVKDVYIVEDSASLNEVSLIFSKEIFRHLPVTRKGKLVGIITRKDIINQMLGHYY